MNNFSKDFNTSYFSNPESDVFYFFQKICTIPHPSLNTDKIADYLVQFAQIRELKYYRDKANNVIIYKNASKGYENKEPIILQGHHDMVASKMSNIAFDFNKESIPAYIDGDFIKTHGTTLGADDGIAVAMMLAILNNENLEHPPIEAVFTADEEEGMLGALALDASKLKGKRLINLDSEEEGVIMCGCAGGIDIQNTIPLTKTVCEGTKILIEFAGMIGGHSGLEIIKGRPNANVLMARLLNFIYGKTHFNIVSLEGGTRETAIAANSKAQIIVSDANTDVVLSDIKLFEQIVKNEYQSVDPNLCIKVSVEQKISESVFDSLSTEKISDVLLAIPNGVISMSSDLENLVQTSCNLGIVKITENPGNQIFLSFINCVRSSVSSQLRWIANQIKSIVKMAGGSSVETSGYPGWKFNPNSNLLNITSSIFQKMYEKKPIVTAVHAGMECGIFSQKIENLDCIAIGPDMFGVHTPFEKLSISSTARVFALVKETLKSL